MLATDTPQNLIKARGVSTLEDAFISYLEAAAEPSVTEVEAEPVPAGEGGGPVEEATAPWRRAFSWQRLGAYTIRETIELMRDPIRLTFALFGPVFLMVVFGFGISTDVNNLTFAVMDHIKATKAALISRSCAARPTSLNSRRSPTIGISRSA